MAIFDKKASFKREHLIDKEDVTQGLYSRGRVLFERKGFFRGGWLFSRGSTYSRRRVLFGVYSRGQVLFEREGYIQKGALIRLGWIYSRVL